MKIFLPAATKQMLTLLLSGSLVLAPAVSATTISYEGIIDGAITNVSGSVEGFSWFDDDAAGVDFWKLQVDNKGLNLNIRGTASTTDLDLAFSLYSGTTVADESEFDSIGDFGGMTFLYQADDEVILNDPLGDPALTNISLAAGEYTIAIGGYDSEDFGPYAYNLSVTTVPVPAAFWLMLAPLAGMFTAGRRKS